MVDGHDIELWQLDRLVIRLTNVLVYAVLSDDPRRPIAERLLAAGGTLSVQVLNEFANVARSKLKWSWPGIETTLALVRGRSVARSLGFDPRGRACARA